MTLSPAVFQDQFAVFMQRVARAGGQPFRGFDQGLAAQWEGYKGALRAEALRRMAPAAWSADDIGSGRILEAAIAGIEITRANGVEANNLTRWEGRFGHANRSHRRFIEARTAPAAREALEAALFAHFHADEDPATSFARLSALAGARYDLLAYLFFLRDWDRFMPIATRTFDRAFAQLGLDVVMSHNASWDNYRRYNAGLGEVRDALRDLAGIAGARLVDAHSFCWLLVRPELDQPAGPATGGAKPKRDPGRTYGAREKSIWTMADNAEQTAKYANGQTVETTRKVKDLLLSRRELEALILELLDRQDDCCALTGIRLQFHGEETDKQRLPSLDRIDSDGHYARDNLQVVCRFVNGWKSATPDEEFRRLLAMVREGVEA